MNIDFKTQLEKSVARATEALVFPMMTDGKKYWVKRRPESKRRVWHRVQWSLAVLLRCSLLMPSVSEGGAASIHGEARRLQLFRAKKLPVPEVIYHDHSILVTMDCGEPLQQCLQDKCEEERVFWLSQAMALLMQVHKAGLSVGRPMPKDLLLKNSQLTLIDLEEAPESVMSRAEAQARDIWLLMNGISGLVNNDNALIEVCRPLLNDIAPETMRALMQLLRILKPLSFILSSLRLHHIGKDVTKAVRATEILAKVIAMDKATQCNIPID